MYEGSAHANYKMPKEAEWIFYLAENCGLISSINNGISEISWPEIEAWGNSVKIDSTWVKMAIKEISKSYVVEFFEAKDPARPSPIDERLEDNEKREKVKNQLRKILAKRK